MRYSRHRGMTLMELLVVITIITVLLGLFAAGASLAFRGGDVRRTRTVLQQAMLAMTEYSTVTEQVISYSGMSSPDEDSMEYFVERIVQVDTAERALRTIHNDLIEYIYDPTERTERIHYLKDAWGTPLQYRSWHDGGPLISGGPSDERTRRGSSDHPQPFFVSAGPDRTFGTEDDIFSFNLD